MKNPFIIGKRVYLRPLEKEGVEGNYQKWFNDPEVNKYMETGIFPVDKKLLLYYIESTKKGSSKILFCH